MVVGEQGPGCGWDRGRWFPQISWGHQEEKDSRPNSWVVAQTYAETYSGG